MSIALSQEVAETRDRLAATLTFYCGAEDNAPQATLRLPREVRLRERLYVFFLGDSTMSRWHTGWYEVVGTEEHQEHVREARLLYLPETRLEVSEERQCLIVPC
ncbi:MAG: hypothetical protein A3D65_04375 [Candidatus Lloydbacteria bacterium RIFCSPHIGHO2_02_FULL_50_13]|uniref:Uncharacterized protein n=1 Tax=Candidatus Lloydbacteria bacterium RIFCSPHIGHO2_02_FULL_50_13 TaxID=1798661 RepID=A0A1G2D2E2_9BACT|nr:MAG: hypothetical protein A3D65_04375 [Candidatus Lloydbacteria bacterium RIFCSPHIGHO2_02_FULL_50_13]